MRIFHPSSCNQCFHSIQLPTFDCVVYFILVLAFQASIVCRQLGFFGALNFTRDSFFGEVSARFSYDNLKCSGFESSLDECPHLNVDDCGPNEAAGVICNPGTSQLFSTSSNVDVASTETSLNVGNYSGSPSNAVSNETNGTNSQFWFRSNRTLVVGFPIIRGPQISLYNVEGP